MLLISLGPRRLRSVLLSAAGSLLGALVGCFESSPDGADGGAPDGEIPVLETNAGDGAAFGENVDVAIDAAGDCAASVEPPLPKRVSAPLAMDTALATQSLVSWMPDASGLLLQGALDSTEVAQLYYYDVAGGALRYFDVNPNRLYGGATGLARGAVADDMLIHNGRNTQSASLYKIGRDGALDELSKTPGGRILSAAWLPNGHDFLYSVDDGDATLLYLHTDAGTSPLASPATGLVGRVASPLSKSFPSSDGQRIVYVETGPPLSEPERLCSVRLDGGDRRVISEDVVSWDSGCAPSLLPDGRVLFLANKTASPGGYELYSATVEGSDLRRLSPGTSGLGPTPGCQLMPDGKSVAFVYNQVLYVSALADGQAKVLSPERPTYGDTIGTPWGVLFSNFNDDLLLASTPDAPTIVLARAIKRPAGVPAPPLVAAGAGRILFQERVDQTWGWFVVKPDGSDRKRLDPYVNSKPLSANLTADGQWAVYPSTMADYSVAMVMARTDGSEAQSVGPMKDAGAWLLHAESGLFAFEKDGSPARYAIAKVGAAATQDIPVPAPFNSVDLHVGVVNDARTTFQADEDRRAESHGTTFHVIRRAGAAVTGARFALVDSWQRSASSLGGPGSFAVLRRDPFTYEAMSLVDGTLSDLLPPGQFLNAYQALLTPDESRVAMRLGVPGPLYNPPHSFMLNYQLWSNAVQGGDPVKLSASLQLADFPSVITSDGRHVVFGATGSLNGGACAELNLFAAKLDGSVLSQLTPASPPCSSPTLALPLDDDARMAVFAVRTDADESGVFMVDIDGQHWRALAPASGDTQAPVSDTTPWPQLTPDGKRLVYRSRTSKLYSVTLDGSDAPVLLFSSLPSSPPTRVVFSDDGTRMAFAAPGLESGFYLTNLQSGGSIPLLEPFNTRRVFDLRSDVIGHDRGRTYLFTEQGLVEVNLDAATSRVVLPLGAEVDLQQAALVPDRNQLVFAADYQTDELQSLYVLDLLTQQVRPLLPMRARGYAVSGIWDVPGQDFVLVQMDGLERGVVELFAVTVAQ